MEEKAIYNDKQIQIIRVAEELFATRGYEGTSVRDIAEAAGINIAMISYYFGSKEKLMEALFDQRTGHIKMRVEALLKDETLSPFEKIDVLIGEHVNKAFELQLFYKIMITDQLINKNPAIAAALIDLKKRNLQVFSQLIENGQQKGVFVKNIDLPLLMNTMVGTVSQTMLNQVIYRDLNGLTNMPDDEAKQFTKTQLSKHIKKVFKLLLTNEL